MNAKVMLSEYRRRLNCDNQRQMRNMNDTLNSLNGRKSKLFIDRSNRFKYILTKCFGHAKKLSITSVIKYMHGIVTCIATVNNGFRI
jgi:hypothetical protein